MVPADWLDNHVARSGSNGMAQIDQIRNINLQHFYRGEDSLCISVDGGYPAGKIFQFLSCLFESLDSLIDFS